MGTIIKRLQRNWWASCWRILVKLELVIDNPILLRWDIKYVFCRRNHNIEDTTEFFWLFSNSSSKIRKLRFSVVLFCRWKSLKMLFFFFCLIVGMICGGRMQEKKLFVLLDVLKRLFFLHVCSIRILQFLLMTTKSLNFQCWYFFFSMSKEEIRNLEFFWKVADVFSAKV